MRNAVGRRAAFVKHLQKHGIDPREVDLNAIASNSASIPDGHSCCHALLPRIPSEVSHTQERESSISSSSTDSPLSSCSSLLDPSSTIGPGFSLESGGYLNPPSSGYHLCSSARYPHLDQAKLSASLAAVYPHEDFFGDCSGNFGHGNDAAFPWVDYPLFSSPFGIPILDASSVKDNTFTRSQTSSPLSSCSSLDFPNFSDLSELPPNHISQDFFFGTQ
ncbi:hypothetical protein SCLCIDRAFT_903584 [Scleroderma citrinum Foug A]|uniref:Uncharacterized protein n=1 Tax=Scleroderma citrinum Foug A TaxID=1036808 RepID=A0A0C3EL33_9AGAM|nr:hypothetical protein SCLCIDRAFT_903584 [Scleroderma citrinum Foug A]